MEKMKKMGIADDILDAEVELGILWQIYAEEVETDEKQPVIQLEWGWTAGMSEEDLKNYAEDAPQGKGVVYTTLDMAIELRNRLNEIISQHEA